MQRIVILHSQFCILHWIVILHSQFCILHWILHSALDWHSSSDQLYSPLDVARVGMVGLETWDSGTGCGKKDIAPQAKIAAPHRLLGWFEREYFYAKKEAVMAEIEAGKTLTEERRKEIFSALVDAQDHEMTVPQSRKLITERFNISDKEIRQIELEGMEHQWPPLG